MGEGVSLGGGSLLAALSPRVQEELLRIAMTVRLPAPEWLFREGDEADRLFIVVAGGPRGGGGRGGGTPGGRVLGPRTPLREAPPPPRPPPPPFGAAGGRSDAAP